MFLMSEVPLYPHGAASRKSTNITATHYYRGTSLIPPPPPPQDQHRSLGIFLLYGPRGALSLMSEVPL